MAKKKDKKAAKKAAKGEKSLTKKPDIKSVKKSSGASPVKAAAKKLNSKSNKEVKVMKINKVVAKTPAVKSLPAKTAKPASPVPAASVKTAAMKPVAAKAVAAKTAAAAKAAMTPSRRLITSTAVLTRTMQQAKISASKPASAKAAAMKPARNIAAGKIKIPAASRPAKSQATETPAVMAAATPPVKIKTYLTKSELRHFEKLLTERRSEVMHDLEIMRSAMTDENNDDSINSSYSMHMADHGTETMDREQRFMFIARDEKYLGYIDKALERIKNGSYGICTVSGKPIPKARLEAVPHTAVRIEYKNR